MATRTTRPRRRSRSIRTHRRVAGRRPVTSSGTRRGWQQYRTKIAATGRGGGQVVRYVRRRAKRRGALAGILTLGVALTVFTLTAVGSISQLAALELGFAAETLALGTAWMVGERKDGSPSPAKKLVSNAKSRAAVCGAPTADKSSCKNRGRCPHHQGGAGGKLKAKGRKTP